MAKGLYAGERENWQLPLLFFFVTLALRVASEPTANLAYLVAAAYALTGRAQAVQALAMSWLISMINPGIAPTAELGSLGRYLVILASAVSAFMRSGWFQTKKFDRFTVLTGALGMFFILHSIVFSPMPDVSILKAFSWTIVMVTLLSAFNGLNDFERSNLSEQLYLGLVAFVLLSLPLLTMSQGNLRNTSGFQGLLNHPQAFGVTIALVGSWAVSRFLVSSKPSWSDLGMSVLCLNLVFLSEARTAGLAFVLGTTSTVALIPLLANRRLTNVLPAMRSKRLSILAGILLVVILFSGASLNQLTTNFIGKGQLAEVDGLVSAYDLSRGVLIGPMIENIRTDPWVGVGFGVPSDPYLLSVTREPLFNLPIAAPIEKGVMPLAIFEELGIAGATLVLLWFWAVLRRSAAAGVAPLSIVITAIVINLGENIFFSPGGMGMLVLILVAMSVSAKPGPRKIGLAT